MKDNYQYDLIIVSTEKMDLINRLTHEKVKGEITLHKAFILGNVQPKRDLPNYICEQDRGCNTSGITNADFNYGYNSFIPQFGTSNVKKVQAKKVGATHLYMSRNVKEDVGGGAGSLFPVH